MKRGGKADRYHGGRTNAHSGRHDLPAALKASEEQLEARLGLRRSNAAARWRNRYREWKLPGKGHRRDWEGEIENDRDTSW